MVLLAALGRHLASLLARLPAAPWHCLESFAVLRSFQTGLLQKGWTGRLDMPPSTCSSVLLLLLLIAAVWQKAKSSQTIETVADGQYATWSKMGSGSNSGGGSSGRRGGIGSLPLPRQRQLQGHPLGHPQLTDPGRTVVLYTHFGGIRVKLLEKLAPRITALVWQLAEARNCTSAYNCAFYRCAVGCARGEK